MIVCTADKERRRSAPSGVFAFWHTSQNIFRARRAKIVRSSIRRTSYDSLRSLSREGAALDVERRDALFNATILSARFCQATEAANIMDSARCCALEPFAKRNESV
jgi:hypothetical protein